MILRYGVLNGRFRRSADGPDMRAQSKGERPGCRTTWRDLAGTVLCVGGGARVDVPGPRAGIYVLRDGDGDDGSKDDVEGVARVGPRMGRGGGGISVDAATAGLGALEAVSREKDETGAAGRTAMAFGVVCSSSSVSSTVTIVEKSDDVSGGSGIGTCS